MSTLRLWYMNVFVTDLGRAVEFYRSVLGLPLQFQEEKFGYACSRPRDCASVSPASIRMPQSRRDLSADTPASGGGSPT